MAIREMNIQSRSKSEAVGEIKRINGYDCIATNNEGIFKIVDNRGGYLVRLDYGREMRFDEKKHKYMLKQVKTNKRVKTETEAKRLKREAEEIREKRKRGETVGVIQKITMEQVIEEFKLSNRYTELGYSYKGIIDNHLKHFLTQFKDFEPQRITVVDIEKYFEYLLTNGRMETIKRKDGTMSKKVEFAENPKGISINTIYKHKCGLKRLWNYMVDSKKYGVTENIIAYAKTPKKVIEIDGKEVTVSKIPYTARSLSLEELNFTLNDALQNEYDRSILAMIALGGIGGLRRGEVVALKVGKFKHDKLMKVSDDALDFGGYDRGYYREHDNLMFIDEQILREHKQVIIKLPKHNKIRVAAIPQCLKKIIDYVLEQREELLTLTNTKITSDDRIYMPVINVIKGEIMNGEKLTRRWREYQKRRNKRMVKAGMEPLPLIRFHDLRQTHSNLLKNVLMPEWETSFNMGHMIPNRNTTKNDYWSDRIPHRDEIIDFFDKNIRLEWDKALKGHIGTGGTIAQINNSGQLVVKDGNREKLKHLRKKIVLSESELVELMYLKEQLLEEQSEDEE